MIYAFQPPRNPRKRDWEKESIHDTVWYYCMPAFIEKKSFRQIEVCAVRPADMLESQKEVGRATIQSLEIF